jgi:hypothetical protein
MMYGMVVYDPLGGVFVHGVGSNGGAHAITARTRKRANRVMWNMSVEEVQEQDSPSKVCMVHEQDSPSMEDESCRPQRSSYSKKPYLLRSRHTGFC